MNLPPKARARNREAKVGEHSLEELVFPQESAGLEGTRGPPFLLRQSQCRMEKNFQTQSIAERSEFIKNEEHR